MRCESSPTSSEAFCRGSCFQYPFAMDESSLGRCPKCGEMVNVYTLEDGTVKYSPVADYGSRPPRVESDPVGHPEHVVVVGNDRVKIISDQIGSRDVDRVQ